MIFKEGGLLDSLIGPNGKTDELKESTKRAEQAEQRLQAVLSEATKVTSDALQEAAVLLSRQCPDFDVDESMKRAGQKLSCPPRRPNGTVSKHSEKSDSDPPDTPE